MEFFPAQNQPARAAVLISHGYAEHLGRYTHLIEAFTAAGIDVFGYDHRAHGAPAAQTGTKRAQVDVGTLIDDHLRARAEVSTRLKARTPVPFFVFGHSMGGIVTAASVQANPHDVAGVILTGPAFMPLPAVPKVVATLGAGVARLFPGLPTARLDATAVSREKDQVLAYVDDPLNYLGPVPLLTATSMVRAGDKVLRTPWPNIPALVVHGDSDRLASIEGSRRLARMSKTVTLHEVAGGFHEVLNDRGSAANMTLILAWLNQQINE